jgi:hypothetical protein
MLLAIGTGMKRTILLTISILLVTAAPMSAQQRGGSPKPPKTTHAAPAPKVKTHVAAPKVKTHVAAPKVKTHVAAPKTTASASKVKTTKTAKASKTTTTTTAGSTTTTLSSVQLKLQKNTNLASKLQSRLPAGTSLTLAAAGFRNLGQFVAAVNVSNNLGIPFAELKTRMVDQGMSLGQAIQDARPRTTDTTVVVRRAETDADVLIRTTEQTTKTKSKKAKKSIHGAR